MASSLSLGLLSCYADGFGGCRDRWPGRGRAQSASAGQSTPWVFVRQRHHQPLVLTQGRSLGRQDGCCITVLNFRDVLRTLSEPSVCIHELRRGRESSDIKAQESVILGGGRAHFGQRGYRPEEGVQEPRSAHLLRRCAKSA